MMYRSSSIDRPSMHFQNRIFALSEQADGAFRQSLDELIGEGGEGAASDHDLGLGKFFSHQPGIRKDRMNMAVVPVQLFQSCEGRDNALDGIARKIKIERVLQGRVTLVRREDLNIPPGEADEIRLETRRSTSRMARLRCETGYSDRSRMRWRTSGFRR